MGDKDLDIRSVAVPCWYVCIMTPAYSEIIAAIRHKSRDKRSKHLDSLMV